MPAKRSGMGIFMEKKLVSFVIPCYRSAQTIGAVTEEVGAAMGALGAYEYEIILVNDGSPDDTFREIRRLCAANPRIRGVDLARNFGQTPDVDGKRHCKRIFPGGIDPNHPGLRRR